MIQMMRAVSRYSMKQGKIFELVFLFAFLIILTACARPQSNQINLMPAPDVYDSGGINPYTDTSPIDAAGRLEI